MPEALDQPQVTVNVPDDVGGEEWSDFMGAIGMALVGAARERFDTQGDGDWPDTQWPRIAELLSDLDDGVVRRRTLDVSHQTGVGTGQLRDSIHYERTDWSEVKLVVGGPEVDYAEQFHTGGPRSIRVPQAEFRRWYRTSEGKAYIREHALGWLFQTEFYEFNQEARPIVTPQLVRDVVEAEARERWPEVN